MSKHFQYDYIIAGAGCAGLSLLVHLIKAGKFNHKKILLIDREIKNKNDRTWCFWEEEAGLFQSIVYKQWQQLCVQTNQSSKRLSIDPYTYKLIRGIDFYAYCFSLLAQHPNISFLQAPIEQLISNQHETYVQAGGQKYTAQYVFNSVLFNKPSLQANQYWLLQHFKGWVIETNTAAFDEAAATLMDFRANQKLGTAFFYVLPFAPNKALIEYTLFSKKLLQPDDYENALKAYVETQLQLNNYTIQEKEFGVIPMTNYQFPAQQNHIIHIGTAGGQTKASSGYTFRFIQKQSAALVKSLLEAGQPAAAMDSKRFHFYDSVLLNILHFDKLPGSEIFSALFLKNNASEILRFLDNETTLQQELKIISSLPTGIFLKSAIQHLARLG